MPDIGMRACAAAGCTALVPYGQHRCTQHRIPRRVSKRAAHVAMYTTGWDKASKDFLARNPLCAQHERMGRLVSASVTDHIVPHRGNETLFWDTSNWQPLCKECHDQKTARQDAPVSVRPEWLPTPVCRVMLVCGPPGSGKSTYVNEHRAGGDEVIDLDVIAHEIGGIGEHDLKGELLAAALHERNRRLAGLARPERAGDTVWVIVCAPIKWRMWWERKLRPVRTIVINTPLAECERRIANDPRRGDVRDAHVLAARAWWRMEVGR